jgi:hypothetical protein
MKFFKRYNEFLVLPVSLILFFVSPYIFHSIDETAATYDIAVFQKIIFGMIVFSFSTGNVWLILRLTFPQVFKYLTEYFDNDFSSLNPNEKCVKLFLSLAVFALYLLGFLLSMQVL